MGVRLLAFAWGLAEDTFFFLAPDLPISFVALGPRRRALVACLLAVAGFWVLFYSTYFSLLM